MSNIFEQTESQLAAAGLQVVSRDWNRPWGGFFVLKEQQAQLFANLYFEGLNVAVLRIAGPLSPKLLLIKPSQRLSWQYHHRRAEIWRVIAGEVGIQRSETDEPGPVEHLKTGSQVTLQQGERHRLIGLTDWAVIAEIWQHTDAAQPSNENDIVRLQDDYGR